MTEHNEEELQNPENWDFENAERRPAVKRPRAVVSVAFSREDYDQLVAYAKRREMKVSEFIRAAALERTAAAPRTIYLDATMVRTDAQWGWLPDRAEDMVSVSA